MNFSLIYHPKIADDLKSLDEAIQKRIIRAIQEKLTVDPYHFGKPLQHSLKGGRSLRIGDYRALYTIQGKEVRVFSIFHRRENYRGLESRLIWSLR